MLSHFPMENTFFNWPTMLLYPGHASAGFTNNASFCEAGLGGNEGDVVGMAGARLVAYR